MARSPENFRPKVLLKSIIKYANGALEKALERFTKLFRSQVKLLTINFHATIYDATMSRIESTKSTFLRRRKSREFPTTCDFHFPAAHTRAQVEKSLSRFSTPTSTAHPDRAWNFSFLSCRSVNFHFPTKTAIKLAIFAKKKNCVHFSSISNWKLIDFVQSAADVRHFRIMLPDFQWKLKGNLSIWSFRVIKWEFPHFFRLFCSLIFETIFIPKSFIGIKARIMSALQLSSVWLAVKCVMCRFSRTANDNKKKKKVQRKRKGRHRSSK